MSQFCSSRLYVYMKLCLYDMYCNSFYDFERINELKLKKVIEMKLISNWKYILCFGMYLSTCNYLKLKASSITNYIQFLRKMWLITLKYKYFFNYPIPVLLFIHVHSTLCQSLGVKKKRNWLFDFEMWPTVIFFTAEKTKKKLLNFFQHFAYEPDYRN